jgi:hypothetical protein
MVSKFILTNNRRSVTDALTLYVCCLIPSPGSKFIMQLISRLLSGVPYAPQRWYLSLGKCLITTGDVSSYADILEVSLLKCKNT